MRMQHSWRSVACLRVRRCCSPAGDSWACCRMPARAEGLRSSSGRGRAGSPSTAASAWQCPRCHLRQVGTAAPFRRSPGALHCTSATCTCRLELQRRSCLSICTSNALPLQCFQRQTCCTQTGLHLADQGLNNLAESAEFLVRLQSLQQWSRFPQQVPASWQAPLMQQRRPTYQPGHDCLVLAHPRLLSKRPAATALPQGACQSAPACPAALSSWAGPLCQTVLARGHPWRECQSGMRSWCLSTLQRSPLQSSLQGAAAGWAQRSICPRRLAAQGFQPLRRVQGQAQQRSLTRQHRQMAGWLRLSRPSRALQTCVASLGLSIQPQTWLTRRRLTATRVSMPQMKGLQWHWPHAVNGALHMGCLRV